MLLRPADRNGTTMPVSGSCPSVPAGITSHCASTSNAMPPAISTRSAVRLRAATTKAAEDDRGERELIRDETERAESARSASRARDRSCRPARAA